MLIIQPKQEIVEAWKQIARQVEQNQRYATEVKAAVRRLPDLQAVRIDLSAFNNLYRPTQRKSVDIPMWEFSEIAHGSF